MEESKELQGFYRIFRAVVYVSVLMEFFEYAIDPAMLDHWGGILCDIHGRIKQWTIYNDGNLVYSKVATVLLICITCIGTRAKKHLEFNARRQVLYPLISGFVLLVLSVWLFGYPMEARLYTLPLNIIFYMTTSLVGGYPRACRTGQHLQVPQGGTDEGPLQLREREFRAVRGTDRDPVQREYPYAVLLQGQIS